MAFDSLSEKLQNVFKNLRSKGRLTEDDVRRIPSITYTIPVCPRMVNVALSS